MNVLLVSPEMPNTFWSFKHALRFIRKDANLPPLGLLTVAALLPPDWNLRLVDLNVTRLTQEDLEWADCAFVSAMVVQRDSARRAIDRCKAAGLTVVAGGPLFTAEYEDFEDVDHFILNEGEITLPPFLADLEVGEARRVYSSEAFADIQQSPVPIWRLVDFDRYASMSLQFSRGCPFDCEFCNITALFGHRPRTKSAEQIVAELDALRAAGWRGRVFFVDDNFIGNKWVLKEEILPALIAWQQAGGQMSFQTEASINLADDLQLMEMMVAAGFDTVFVGIETPSAEGLEECNKLQNRHRDLLESVQSLHRAGLQVQGGFIIGFDSDTTSIFQRQIDFIQQSGIISAMVGILQAPYGTRLYERLKREGRLLHEMSGDNTDGTTNIIPKMDLQVLQEGYQEILQNIYAPAHYYERVKTFLRDYRPPEIRFSLDLDYLHAFLRSIALLGIWGKERWHYWKLFFWSLFRRPRLFPLAITAAIYGYHFRKTYRV
ncbi:MAG: B12-binding domain-containing radical SAM protein [Anaerolineales bacterium]